MMLTIRRFMSIPYLLADKQQKLEQKMTELQDIKDKVNFYDVAYVRFDVPEIKVRPPKITERPPRFGNIDDWMKAQNATVASNSIMLSILLARLSWMQQRIAFSENVSFG